MNLHNYFIYVLKNQQLYDIGHKTVGYINLDLRELIRSSHGGSMLHTQQIAMIQTIFLPD